MTSGFSKRVLAKTGALDLDAGVERDASGDVVAFRLFKAGRFETDHGASVFDATAAKKVLEDRARRANRFALDYDHLSLRDDATPEQRRAAGSFDIELRGGELWAVSLRLTTEAAKMLREGAILSVSPAWNQDPSTGRVISLLNCALTNNPATHGAVRLAASRGVTTIFATWSTAALLDLVTASRDHGMVVQAKTELDRRGVRNATNDPRLWQMASLVPRPAAPKAVNVGRHQYLTTGDADEIDAFRARVRGQR